MSNCECHTHINEEKKAHPLTSLPPRAISIKTRGRIFRENMFAMRYLEAAAETEERHRAWEMVHQ